jgi:hypothetical protein
MQPFGLLRSCRLSFSAEQRRADTACIDRSAPKFTGSIVKERENPIWRHHPPYAAGVRSGDDKLFKFNNDDMLWAYSQALLFTLTVSYQTLSDDISHFKNDLLHESLCVSRKFRVLKHVGLLEAAFASPRLQIPQPATRTSHVKLSLFQSAEIVCRKLVPLMNQIWEQWWNEMGCGGSEMPFLTFLRTVVSTRVMPVVIDCVSRSCISGTV